MINQSPINNNFSFLDLANILPSSTYFPEESSWNSVINSLGKAFDAIFSEDLYTLKNLRNPLTVPESYLPYVLNQLGFNWSRVSNIDVNKQRILAVYLPIYYQTACAGSVVVYPTISNIDDSGFININSIKLLQFLTNNLIQLIPLWTNDNVNFYSKETAIPGGLTCQDTIYLTESVIPDSVIPFSSNLWFLSSKVNLIVTQNTGFLSIDDVISLFYYLMPANIALNQITYYVSEGNNNFIEQIINF
jgi:hypothetical protein